MDNKLIGIEFWGKKSIKYLEDKQDNLISRFNSILNLGSDSFRFGEFLDKDRAHILIADSDDYEVYNNINLIDNSRAFIIIDIGRDNDISKYINNKIIVKCIDFETNLEYILVSIANISKEKIIVFEDDFEEQVKELLFGVGKYNSMRSISDTTSIKELYSEILENVPLTKVKSLILIPFFHIDKGFLDIQDEIFQLVDMCGEDKAVKWFPQAVTTDKDKEKIELLVVLC